MYVISESSPPPPFLFKGLSGKGTQLRQGVRATLVDYHTPSLHASQEEPPKKQPGSGAGTAGTAAAPTVDLPPPPQSANMKKWWCPS